MTHLWQWKKQEQVITAEDYFDNGRPDDYWDVMADAKYEEERDER